MLLLCPIPLRAAFRRDVRKEIEAAAFMRFAALRRSGRRMGSATVHLCSHGQHRANLTHVPVDVIELHQILLVEHDVALVE
jgi:hypothetical protein